MLISINAHLEYLATTPTTLLLQIEAAKDSAQVCETEDLTLNTPVQWTVISGEETIGLRRWGLIDGPFDCTYSARVRVDRQNVTLARLGTTPYAALPEDVVKFLMPSRYCHPEDFLEFVAQTFGAMSGGRLAAAMADWITGEFTYDIAASNASTTATDSFRARAGVCRDYAHVLIAMARAAGIPARIVSAYAPDVSPQDFHAVVEIYLDDAWHLVDPTGMAQPCDLVRIGVGRDAADISFMTSYGWMELIKQSVTVSRVD